MDYYEDEPPVYAPVVPPRPRDPKTDEARAALVELFGDSPSRVFFGRQIEVLLEKEFFHWITSRALSELIAEGKVGAEKVTLRTGVPVKFCTSKGNRYWKREARKVGDLIVHYSDPVFTRALAWIIHERTVSVAPTAGNGP